jgi:GNAT superfamily N-acetyltransferase
MAVIFREAQAADLPAIVAMLTDDILGKVREGHDMAPYQAAFAEIAADPASRLIVGEDEGRIVATCQLTIIPGLSRRGARRALVEAVRVLADLRSSGIGAALMAEVEAQARAAGAVMIQLTTDRARLRAHAFYEKLGYEQSHLGYKKAL